MCINCWVVNHNSSSIINSNVMKAARLIDEIYSYPEGICGDFCHIVIDDWNLKNSSLKLCLTQVKEQLKTRKTELLAIEKELLLLMGDMTIEERASAMAMHEGYLDKPGDANGV